MSTTYNGAAANISPPAAVNIATSTNTNPIIVGTATPHGLASGDTVDIRNHQTNTAANGVWAATVTGTTTFTIPVAGVGVGGATGTMQSLAVGAVFAIPSDGDADAAASVNVAFQTLADRDAFLGSGTGVAKLAGRVVLYLADTTGVVSWGQASVTAVANTWYPLATTGSFFAVLVSQANSSIVHVSLAPPFSVAGAAGANDSFRITLSCNTVVGGATPSSFGLFYVIVPPGGSLPGGTFPSGWTQVPGCNQYTFGSGGSGIGILRLEGWVQSNTAGTLYVQPAVYSLAVTGGATWNVSGDALLTIECWRATGMPQ